MKDFVVIVKSTAGKVDKFQDFDTQAEAETHVNGYDIEYFAIGGVEGVEAVEAAPAIEGVEANEEEGIEAIEVVPAIEGGEGVEAVEAVPAWTERVPGYGGLVVPNPGGGTEYWTVDPVAEKVTNDQVQADADLKMKEWLSDMSETDASMPRWFEDYIDENGITLATGRVKDNYDKKKNIRARKPS